MNFGDLVWMNNKIVGYEEAKVPIATAGLQYGLAIFENIRAYPKNENVYMFRLEEHMNRLFESAKVYGMKIPYTKEEISEGVKEIIKANNLHAECQIRIVVYKGALPKFGLRQSLDVPVEISIITSPSQSSIGTKEFEKGKSALVSSWRRISPDSMPPLAKCVANYANGALGLMEARQKGFDYVIFLDTRGFVSEGSGQNIFVVKGEELATPPECASILMGITRDTILKLAADLKNKASEKDLSKSQLYTADEVFFCGTAAEIVPVVDVDGINISETAGPLTREIAFLYKDLVAGNLLKYRNWLTSVY